MTDENFLIGIILKENVEQINKLDIFNKFLTGSNRSDLLAQVLHQRYHILKASLIFDFFFSLFPIEWFA